MNVENEKLFVKEDYDNATMFAVKALVYILYDHKMLAQIVAQSKKISDKNPLFLYFRSLSQLVLGQFKNAQKCLIQVLNNSLQQLGIKQQNTLDKKQTTSRFCLLDKNQPNLLNIRQQIFMNLMIFKMYESASKQKQKTNTAKKLYQKIISINSSKQNSNQTSPTQKLTLDDLVLSSTQQYNTFLNIWISHKFDAPMQWTDLIQQSKVEYYRYIYLLAQNYYVEGNKQQCFKIVQQLPYNYPLRIFLQMTHLYDMGKFYGLMEKLSIMQKQIQDDKTMYKKLPQYDAVFVNIYQLAKKAQQKLASIHKPSNSQNISKSKQNQDIYEQSAIFSQQKQNQKQNQIVLQKLKSNDHAIKVQKLQYQITMLKANFNIISHESKGIPFYYLNLPLFDFLVAPEINKCFAD